MTCFEELRKMVTEGEDNGQPVAVSLRDELQKLEEEKERVSKEIAEKRALMEEVNNNDVNVEAVLGSAVKLLTRLMDDNKRLTKERDTAVAALSQKTKDTRAVARSRSASITQDKQTFGGKPPVFNSINSNSSTATTNTTNTATTTTTTTTTTQLSPHGMAVKWNDSRGNVVTSVEPGSAAHGAGVRIDDVIVQLNRQFTRTQFEYKRASRLARPGSPLRVLVRRKNASIVIEINSGDTGNVVPTLPIQTLPLSMAIKERETNLKKQQSRQQPKPRGANHARLM